MDTVSEDILVQLDKEFLLRVAQTLNISIAIIALESWEIIFENACFFKWFPPGAEADETLGERIPKLKTDRVEKRIQAGRVFTSEVETLSDDRGIPIAVEIRSLGNQYDKLLVVEGHDITKQRQSEYMLESYSKIAEKKMLEIWREKKAELNDCSLILCQRPFMRRCEITEQ